MYYWFINVATCLPQWLTMGPILAPEASTLNRALVVPALYAFVPEYLTDNNTDLVKFGPIKKKTYY